MDPYAASVDEYIELIEQKYELVEVLENEPDKDEMPAAIKPKPPAISIIPI